ncbi:MAG: Npt1/Npt2 family nucleotide transporter [Myxococcota bacterium]
MNSATRGPLAALAVLGFLLMLHYGLLCVCVDSLFLRHYHSDRLTHVWLLTACFTLAAVHLYNRVNHRTRVITLLGIAGISTGVLNLALLAAYGAGWSGAVFALKAWKDTYIIVLVQMFWSFAALIFSFDKAKRTYGWLLAVGTIGTLTGHAVAGMLVSRVGTHAMAWWSLPALAACAGPAWHLWRTGHEGMPPPRDPARVSTSFHVVWRSRYLFPLLLLMLVAKTSITFLDYEFNAFVQQTYPDTDARTAFTGNIRVLITALAAALQLGFAPLIQGLGLGAVFASVPILMGASMLAHMATAAITVASVYVSGKTLDYSLLRLGRELLYVKLNRDEKTKGKACIDVLIFRLSKGGSALLLMALLHVGADTYIPHAVILLQLLWFALALVIVRRWAADSRIDRIIR